MVFYLGRKNKKGRGSKRLGFVMRTSRKGDRILSILDDIKKEENEKNDLLEEQAIEEKAQNIYTTIEELSKKVKQEPIHQTEKDAPVNIKELDKAAQFLGVLEKYEDDNRLHVGYFTERDKNVAGILDPRKSIQSFLEFVDSIPGKMDYVYNKYCEADKNRVDFEHNIELCYENCYQTWLLTRMFKYTLMERRDYKNLKSALSIVKKFCDDHKKAIDTLRMVVNKLDDLEELKENRYYCPRSELDLPVNRPFRELSKEKQSVLLRNLELAQNKNY